MFEMKLPKIREDVDESLVVIWFVSAGDTVKKGDRLLEVQTEKEVTEIESERDGVIKEIKVKRGESAKVDEVLVLIGEDGKEKEAEEQKLVEAAAEPDKTGKKPAAKRKGKKPEEQEIVGKIEKPAEEKAQETVQETVQETPRVAPGLRKLARELGVDLENVKGTGRNGKITEEDIRGAGAGEPEAAEKSSAKDETSATDEASATVEDAATTEDSGSPGGLAKADGGKAQETAGAEPSENIIPLTGTRGVIARRMTQSLQQSAQLTEMAWADVTKLEAKKEKLGEGAGWTALFGKAVAHALQNHPALNAHISENGIQLKKTVDLGFAIDTENGLLVASVPRANEGTASELHQKLGELAEKARSGKLSKEESSGSSFTVTSLGGHSVQFFTPIINPPETAILGIGKIEDYLVMEGRKVRVRRRVPLSLTVDHRAIDGAPAAKFLDELIRLLEKPKRFLEKKEK
ncbi:dihydrolipoamide acetyltransferase family protein [Planococcus sp. FY231025]|uniref:dihydrolipoamide acetyltransferase family protein n=1 Tax=Planococcus sp. FY231025 TaxID=3455699 RepID=UPI003F91970D